MPSEGKKVAEVTVAVMEAEDGQKYLHATGEGIFDYVTVWNSQMLQARQEEREKIADMLEKEYGEWLRDVIADIRKMGSDESSANDQV